jgi:hypothetical protein
MQDALVWTALAAIAGLGLFVLGIVKWIAGIARQLAIAETAAQRADATAAGAIGKCELLGTDFHNHRVETAARVAEINAKADNAAQAIVLAEHRLAKAMDDFGARLDKIVDRLDRVLEHPNSQRRE